MPRGLLRPLLLPPSHPVPNFYLYPSPFDHEKLMACFERTKHKPWNVTADTGAWMYHAPKSTRRACRRRSVRRCCTIQRLRI